MARVFITGSTDGLGKMAAEHLVAEGHRVVLHARNPERAQDALLSLPGAEAIVIGDLTSIKQTKHIAKQVNRLGRFDAVIHNAGIGYLEPRRIQTEDGLPHLFAVNTLAPYILTALIERPDRLIYMGSDSHYSGDSSLSDLTWEHRPWQAMQAYADTKLQDVMLAFGVARRWKNVYSNAVDPGWVPTKMGGNVAPDDLAQGPLTQAWLAVSEEARAKVSSRYWYHLHYAHVNPDALDVKRQEKLIEACGELSGVVLAAH
jgi:NAD(P)-dependent dehydrogenase (short-subunit alcohol dehydrogenase family)